MKLEAWLLALTDIFEHIPNVEFVYLLAWYILCAGIFFQNLGRIRLFWGWPIRSGD